MTIALKTREQFTQDEIAAIQAQLPNTFQFPVGSVVNALVQAHSATAIWEESLIQYVLAACRLSTSTGTQVTSFLTDFGVPIPPAVAATGNVTFSSFSSTSQRTIPAQTATQTGATVSTAINNGIQFVVIPDTTNSYYNPTLQAYVMPVSVSSIPALVQCTQPGVIGNVVENSIVVINSPIVGIDTVTNSSNFTNGQPVKTDAQLRSYFVTYLNGLSKATIIAVAAAIEQVPQVVSFNIVENQNYTDNSQELGYFYVVVDDGTGSPPMSLLTAVFNQVDPVRPLAVRFQVFAPITITANISANIVLPSSYNDPNQIANLITAVQSALSFYIVAIPFGDTFFYTRISQIIYSVIDGLRLGSVLTDQFNVNDILLNSGTSDITSTPQQKFIVGTLNITTS